jgi:hypothetical protein
MESRERHGFQSTRTGRFIAVIVGRSVEEACRLEKYPRTNVFVLEKELWKALLVQEMSSDHVASANQKIHILGEDRSTYRFILSS